jgi:hypothetical protein
MRGAHEGGTDGQNIFELRSVSTYLHTHLWASLNVVQQTLPVAQTFLSFLLCRLAACRVHGPSEGEFERQWPGHPG